MRAVLDVKLALENFKARKAANEGKQIDNSSLPAGALMYFYCKHCGVLTDTKPESYFTPPKVVCDPCQALVDHGVRID